jgi:hypothetical protein
VTLAGWLAPMPPVLRTFLLATIAVPIVIYGLMPHLQRARVHLLKRAIPRESFSPVTSAPPGTKTSERSALGAVRENSGEAVDVHRLGPVSRLQRYTRLPALPRNRKRLPQRWLRLVSRPVHELQRDGSRQRFSRSRDTRRPCSAGGRSIALEGD